MDAYSRESIGTRRKLVQNTTLHNKTQVRDTHREKDRVLMMSLLKTCLFLSLEWHQMEMA